MLNYLSKFVLQMLPTISATVIGAYIVATWINPKTPPNTARVTAAAQPDATAASAAARNAATARDEAKAKAVVEDAKPEDAKPVKAANASDKVRIIPIIKQPAVPITASSDASATEAEPALDERKDVNELARAAIERLRGGSGKERAADEPASTAATARHQPARVTAESPRTLPAAMVAPPLPPAISVAAPRYLRAEGMDAEGIDPATSGLPDRLAPPGEIPAASNPLNLQASHRIAEHPSPAEDFLLATKSFFRAIAPH